MGKELFNAGSSGNTGTLKSTLSDSDRIAVGVPGFTGSDNITYANLRKIIDGRYKYEFTSAQLVADILTVTHNKNSTNISFDYMKPDGTKQSIDDLITIVSANQFTVSFSGGIDPGTHTIYYKIHPDL